jgi:uncharacterized protein YkwD
MRYYTTYLIFVLLFVSASSLAQKEINVKLLESLVKAKVDSVRATKGLQSLINDSILYLASKDHGNYLKDKRELTHFQNENMDKKTPQMRAEFYGAKNYSTGENIVMLPFDERSAGAVAYAMVDAWVHSKGHYANMVNGDYDITGLAIHIDTKNKRIFAVQTFASVNEFYLPKDNKELFPYALPIDESVKRNYTKSLPKKHKKHAYGITDRNKVRVCSECDKEVFIHENIHVMGYRDSVYVRIKKGSLQKVKNFFQNDEDGLAFEFVIFDYTYSCNPANNVTVPTRRNGTCEFDGPITEPKYKEYILQEIQRIEVQNALNKIRLEKDEMIDLNLGRFPDRVRGKRFEMNLLVLKKNRLCQVVPSVASCGEEMLNALPIIPYAHQLTPVTYVPQIKPSIKNIKVYFEKNKSSVTSDTVIDAVNEIKNNNQKIVKAKIKAFSSVEGSLTNNEKLFIKRAESVLKQFEAHQDSLIPYEIETKENWPLFKKQLANSKLKYLLDYDSLKLRAFVNDTANSTLLEPLFAEQRYAIMTLYIKPKITAENVVRFALSHYRVLAKSKTFSNSTVAKMVEIQQFLFNEVRKGKLNRDSVRLDFPRKEVAFVPMLFNEVMFDYLFGGDSLGTEYLFHSKMEELNKIDPSNQSIVFNWYASLFNADIYQGVSERLKNTGDFIKILEQQKVGVDTLHEFRLHENHLIVNKYYYRLGGRLKTAESSLQFIKRYYENLLDTASEEFKFKLARYYVFSEQFPWAMDLLKPMALKENFNHAIYILYLKVYQSMMVVSPEYSDLNLQLFLANEKLTQKEWCNLFIGSCNINFQIFDDATLRNMYCESCMK